jgi:hypothetical protein
LGSESFHDTLSLGLFKLRQSVFTNDTLSLDYILSETHTGSLDYHRQIGDKNGGAALSFYLGKSTETSPNISIVSNPYINSKNTIGWETESGIPSKKVRLLTKQLENPQVTCHYDFDEFKKAKLFVETSQPLQHMIRKLQNIQNNFINKNAVCGTQSKIILNTARSDFDNVDFSELINVCTSQKCEIILVEE